MLAGEGDLVDVRDAPASARAGGLTEAGDDVDDAVGKPASCASSAMRSAVSGVCSAGFSTTVYPAASAGPHFQPRISSGKFQGMICPTTPTGSRRV